MLEIWNKFTKFITALQSFPIHSKTSNPSSIWRGGIDQKYFTQAIDPIEHMLKMTTMLWWHTPPLSWYLSWLKECLETLSTCKLMEGGHLSVGLPKYGKRLSILYTKYLKILTTPLLASSLCLCTFHCTTTGKKHEMQVWPWIENIFPIATKLHIYCCQWRAKKLINWCTLQSAKTSSSYL